MALCWVPGIRKWCLAPNVVSYGFKMLTKLFLVLLVTFVLNLPFGAWRQGFRKFSLPWWLAIHLPIPLVIAFRIGLGIPYATVPLVIGAAVLGQWVGGRLKKRPSP